MQIKKLSKPLAIATAMLCTATFTASAEAAIVRANGNVNFSNFGVIFNSNTPGHVVLSYDENTAPFIVETINGAYAGYGIDHFSGDLICSYENSSTVETRSVEWEDTTSFDVTIPTANLYLCNLQQDTFDGETPAPIYAAFTPAAVEERKLAIEIVRDGQLGLESADTLRLFKSNAFTTATYIGNYNYLNNNDPNDFYNYKLADNKSDITQQGAVYVLPSQQGVMRFGQLLRDGSKLITRATATTTVDKVVS